MISKLSTLVRLPANEVIATAEAIAALSRARLEVRFVPPAKWHEHFRKFHAVPRAALSQDERKKAAVVTRAVRRARRNVPLQYICLPQALAAGRMLGRRNIPSDLFIGVAKHARNEDRFHAWLKVGDEFVTGDCVEDDYAIFSG